MQYFISPKRAKFQPFQRQETPLSSVREKHKSADILQEAWGDLFLWSSTFSQFQADLPNLGLQTYPSLSTTYSLLVWGLCEPGV